MNAQIIITISPNGCNVQDAIDNKLVAFGMLELAKEAIAEHHRSKSSSVVAATPADALLIGGAR